MQLTRFLKPKNWFGTYSVWWDLKWSILNRTFCKHHVIKTDLEPGWYDKDTLMIHGLFQLLVDFVEVELGHQRYTFDNKDTGIVSKWSKSKRLRYWLGDLPLIRYIVKTKFIEHGLKGVDFYVNYEDPQFPDSPYIETHRHFGREVKQLYVWWKELRPARVEPIELSGFSDLCDQYGRLEFEPVPETNGQLLRQKKRPEEVEKLFSEAGLKTHEIEEQYDAEDEEMMIRLVKIRKSMWT